MAELIKIRVVPPSVIASVSPMVSVPPTVRLFNVEEPLTSRFLP